MIDQVAEACRWLAVEKKLGTAEIAKRMNLTQGAVINALKRAGIERGYKRRVERVERVDRNPILIEPRDVCIRCGTRADVHAMHGCRRFG